MRADRLVSLVLLLRRRGQLTADTIADELEVSTRTVLRDIESLSAAGVPVYAERGRHGGFALLPGFRTELTGLNHDEALALLTAGTGRGGQAFGLGSALASAMRKVVDALPEGHRATADDAVQRILVEPETDLLSRRSPADEVPDPTMIIVRRAVLTGHRLRIEYAAADAPPRWRTVDPIGLVTVRGRSYLLATRDGEDRTYRLSRISDAEALPDLAERPSSVDLERIWRERSARFLSGGDTVTVLVRVQPRWLDDLLDTAVAVRVDEVGVDEVGVDEVGADELGTDGSGADAEGDGTLRLHATFQDARHAEWAMWQLGSGGEALAPEWLRASLHRRAVAFASQYAE